MRISSAGYNYPGHNRFINSQVAMKHAMPISFTNDSVDIMQQHSDLRVFKHHIYEYKKGLRNLVLTTEKAKYRAEIESRLKKDEIPYVINEISEKNINVFFGKEDCIRIVSTFDSGLNNLSAEKDFMLGTMLGYSNPVQCERYIKKSPELFKKHSIDLYT